MDFFGGRLYREIPPCLEESHEFGVDFFSSSRVENKSDFSSPQKLFNSYTPKN